jgi:hypothetical protein
MKNVAKSSHRMNVLVSSFSPGLKARRYRRGCEPPWQYREAMASPAEN